MAPAGILLPGLFGTREIHSENLRAFPKWTAALQRFKRELDNCKAADCTEWNDLVAMLRGWSATTQMVLLNAAINRHRYIEDWANWELADYWATPLQFLAHDGDCEDFAIAKYLALRQVGVPVDRLRVVIVRDHARNRMHAVLAVFVAGRALIMDNLRDDIVSAELVRQYEPVYSINEQGWWLHRR